MALVYARKSRGMGTRISDLVSDIEGQVVVRKGMEAVRRAQAQVRLKTLQFENSSSSTPEGGGVFECSLEANVLSRKVHTVVDTGASHSIVSFRTIRKLRLRSLTHPSKKVFITAAGELTFPVGEIAALPLTIRVNCMVVGKACFSQLLGLDVMKPMGAVIDLQRDTFAFSDKTTGRRAQVALQYGPCKKTLMDVKMVSQYLGCACFGPFRLVRDL